MRRALALLLLSGLFCACGRDDRAAPPDQTEPASESVEAPEPEPEPAEAPEPSEEVEGPDDAPKIDEARPSAGEMEHGCYDVGPAHRVAEGAGTAEVIAHAGGYAIALYVRADDAERVEVHAGPVGGPPRLLESIALDEASSTGRAVAPALVSLGERGLLLAYVDTARTVHARRVGRPRSDREIGARVDIRFPPALARYADGALLAFTAGDEVSHVYVVQLDARLKARARVDVTPPASGASAPSFVRGADEPTLAFVDARLGFSPVYTRTFGEKLADPVEPVLVRPISHLLEPVQVLLARHRGLDHIGFTGRGANMGSAVGWVRAGEDAALPASVVSPSGVGHLRLGLDVLPSGALLFAGDSPLAREKGAPREVHLRALTGDRLGEPVRVRGSDGTAARPALASLGGGKVAVVFSTRRGIELVHAECEVANPSE